MTSDKLICVSVVTGAHGILGHVKIKSFTSPPSNLTEMDLYDANQNKVVMKLIRCTGDILTCSIKGINDRTTAEKLRGLKFFVYRSTLPDEGNSEYYIEDLLGITVQDVENKVVGIVMMVHNFGGGDIIEIKFHNNEIEMFPFTMSIFPEIDKERITFVRPNMVPDNEQNN